MTTKIEWTETTWNPVRGCRRVSAGCDNCYAMRQAHRFSGPGRAYEGLTKLTKRGVDWTGRARLVPERLEDPLRWRKPRHVFVNSMSDLFHEDLTTDEIFDVIDVMERAKDHTFQVLTKRARRMFDVIGGTSGAGLSAPPLPNVWWGVSVENQKTADERIPWLMQTPAEVRWVSYEPALGPIDFPWVWSVCNAATQAQHEAECMGGLACEEVGLDWLVLGGESGNGARPFDVEWARSVIAQCRSAGVPCFVKQLGAEPAICASEAAAYPRKGNPGNWRLRLHHKKGGDMSEWPEDLRVREFPTVA